jgi:CheY-like chemotaxis protein
MQPVTSKVILIADDYDDAAALLAVLINQIPPYEAISAKDGEEALERAKQRRPDAAILDIDMPRIGGIEAACAMRQMFAEQTPLLIAVTGRESISEIVRSGVFDHVLRKPVDIDGLMRLLDKTEG